MIALANTVVDFSGILELNVIDDWEEKHETLLIELTDGLIKEARQWAAEKFGEQANELSDRDVVILFINT